MRRLCLALALLAAASALAAAPAVADDWRVTTGGYGPAKIGMTVAEASAALGTKLVSEGPVDEPTCHYMRPEPAVEGLWFMISDDHVVRVEVTTAGIKTRSGLGVGDSEARVKQLLPSAEQRGVGSVDDRVDRERRDIGDDYFQLRIASGARRHLAAADDSVAGLNAVEVFAALT